VSALSLVLARLVPRFLERYPKVELDVRVEDHLVDIVTDGLDAGIRLIEAIDRDMVHVRLSPPGRPPRPGVGGARGVRRGGARGRGRAGAVVKIPTPWQDTPRRP
jgi:DNA-binding transcriptional LysR family regulator